MLPNQRTKRGHTNESNVLACVLCSAGLFLIFRSINRWVGFQDAASAVERQPSVPGPKELEKSSKKELRQLNNSLSSMKAIVINVAALIAVSTANATLRGSVLAERQDLFVPSARFPCFRQPVLLATSGAILAFAENRNVSACAPNSASSRLYGAAPNEVGSLQLRRSVDGGSTWTSMQSLMVGNIDFYSAVHDASTNTTWVMLEYVGPADDSLEAGTPSTVKVLRSQDLGQTWNELPDLAVGLPAPFMGGQFKPAVGHGIQLRNRFAKPGSADNDGRLIIPFVCANTSAPKPSGDTGACPGHVHAKHVFLLIFIIECVRHDHHSLCVSFLLDAIRACY